MFGFGFGSRHPGPSGAAFVRGGIDRGPGNSRSSLDVGPLVGPSIDSAAWVTSDLVCDPHGSDSSSAPSRAGPAHVGPAAAADATIGFGTSWRLGWLRPLDPEASSFGVHGGARKRTRNCPGSLDLTREAVPPPFLPRPGSHRAARGECFLLPGPGSHRAPTPPSPRWCRRLGKARAWLTGDRLDLTGRRPRGPSGPFTARKRKRKRKRKSP